MEESTSGDAVITPRVLVLSGLGINCERETAAAFRLAGAEADIVHVNSLLGDPGPIGDSQIVVFPGGFAFGDRLGAGQALANRIRHRKTLRGKTLFDHLVEFVERGGYVLGICNGFQVLTKLGLVPNTGGQYEQEVALATNATGRFENRWSRLILSATGPGRKFASLGPIELPVRHGEGRLTFRDEGIREAAIEQSLAWLTYASKGGSVATEFPDNPNGADLSCAGLSDTSGHVFGLMPHPEAYISPYLHYNWPRRLRDEQDKAREADGLRLFRVLVKLAITEREPGLDG